MSKFEFTRTPPRHLRELVDPDYADRLSPEEREWMNAFYQGFYEGRGPMAEQANEGRTHTRRDGKVSVGKRAAYCANQAALRDATHRAHRVPIEDRHAVVAPQFEVEKSAAGRKKIGRKDIAIGEGKGGLLPGMESAESAPVPVEQDPEDGLGASA